MDDYIFQLVGSEDDDYHMVFESQSSLTIQLHGDGFAFDRWVKSIPRRKGGGLRCECYYKDKPIRGFDCVSVPHNLRGVRANKVWSLSTVVGDSVIDMRTLCDTYDIGMVMLGLQIGDAMSRMFLDVVVGDQGPRVIPLGREPLLGTYGPIMHPDAQLNRGRFKRAKR